MSPPTQPAHTFASAFVHTPVLFHAARSPALFAGFALSRARPFAHPHPHRLTVFPKITCNARSSSPSSPDSSPGYPIVESFPVPSIDFRRAPLLFSRIGWVSWWIQLVLILISSVIMIFALAIMSNPANGHLPTSTAALGLTIVSLLIAFVSFLSTSVYMRIANKLMRAAESMEPEIEAASLRLSAESISRALRFGITVAFLGILVGCVGLEALVGTLLASALSVGMGGAGTGGVGRPGPGQPPINNTGIMPIDLLVLQAAANTMLALFSALISSCWLSLAYKKKQKKHIAPGNPFTIPFLNRKKA